MASPISTLELNKSSSSGIMVGVIFDEGVVLAITMTGNLIYYLDDRIYCCANSSGYDREALLEAATKLENMSQKISGFKGATVAQTLEMLTKKYESVEGAELLLAGEDVCGLHLVTLKSFGAFTSVYYAALGAGAEGAIDYLKMEWKSGLSLRQAEMLARKAIAIGNTNISKVDLCVIFKRSEETTE